MVSCPPVSPCGQLTLLAGAPPVVPGPTALLDGSTRPPLAPTPASQKPHSHGPGPCHTGQRGPLPSAWTRPDGQQPPEAPKCVASWASSPGFMLVLGSSAALTEQPGSTFAQRNPPQRRIVEMEAGGQDDIVDGHWKSDTSVGFRINTENKIVKMQVERMSTSGR